jgi:hypothetical protein
MIVSLFNYPLNFLLHQSAFFLNNAHKDLLFAPEVIVDRALRFVDSPGYLIHCFFKAELGKDITSGFKEWIPHRDKR